MVYVPSNIIMNDSFHTHICIQYVQETPRDGIFNKQFKLKQFPKFDVTIVAKEFTPFTTSDKAGGKDRCIRKHIIVLLLINLQFQV